MIRAALSTPGGTGLIGAQTYPQLENTAKLEFKKMLTNELIANESAQKNWIDLINGYRVLFRSFDDEGKIRSLNLCHWWIEEGSEVKFDIFVQLQTRLRNNKTDKHFGIISTNPDINWIRTDFLLVSDSIQGAETNYYQNQETINPAFSTHVATTKMNTYLPEDYYDTVAKNKPDWWIKRFLHGSFEHTTGQVYPMFSDCIIPSIKIPKNWQRFMAADFGMRDPTAVLWGAVDPKKGEVHIYKEHYESLKPIPYHAQIINAHNKEIPAGMLNQPIGDSAGKKRSEFDGRSTFDHYEEYGIFFKEASKGIEAGIAKVYTFMSLGKLKIHDCCVNTINEGVNYKYKPAELKDEKNLDEKPVDKDNHAMDCLRYLVQELPDNPENLKNPSYSIYAKNGRIVEKSLPFALQDDNDRYSSGDWYYSAY